MARARLPRGTGAEPPCGVAFEQLDATDALDALRLFARGGSTSSVRRIAPRGTRQGLMVRRSALRADCTVLLGPVERGTTRYALTRCARTNAASQSWEGAHCVRASPGPALRVAAQIAPAGCRTARVRDFGCARRKPLALPRRRCGAGRDAPERRREAQRSRPRAQRASTPDLARLFERSAKRVASCAPGQDRASQGSRRSRPPNRSVATCPAPASLARTTRTHCGR